MAERTTAKRKKGRGGRGTKSSSTEGYKFVTCIREDHASQIYAIAFYEMDPEVSGIFATVGANRTTVYSNDDQSISVRQSFVDEDPEETLYTLAWTRDGVSGNPWLMTAGTRGIIKVIDCTTHNLIRALTGHGNAINDLRVHPIDTNIILSASKDESIRMWNIATGVLIACFAGDAGHRDEVLSADVHGLGNCFLSAGMDNTVKVWALDSEDMQAAVHDSYRHLPTSKRPFDTRMVQFPAFSTAKVHGDYVDCVRWSGNLIVSKSTGNCIVLWTPDVRRGEDAVMILQKYHLPEADIWYLRISLDVTQTVLVAGNRSGKVHLWDIDPPADGASDSRLGGLRAKAIIQHPKCTTVVRQACLSRDGGSVLFVCDNATLWRYDST